MSARDAAIKVLQDAGGPLSVSEITRRIPDRRLWSTASATPEATVRAVLGEEVRTRGVGCDRATPSLRPHRVTQAATPSL